MSSAATTSISVRAWLCLALLLACQTDRSERRSGAPPAEPAAVPAPSATAVESARPAPSSPTASSGGVALRRPREPLSVILITVDAWRADMPWLAPSARDVAPQLTSWVKESVLWENHRTVSSHTPQSLAALTSGRLPCTLYRDGALYPTYAADNVFLPELLQAKGIRTLGVQTDPELARGRGFEQGFDVWESLAGGNGAGEPHGERAAARLMALLAQPAAGAGQFFAWLHLNDLLDPRSAQQAPGGSERERYERDVRLVDGAVGKLLELARRQAWWERTAVILTGSRGQSLGEHGMSPHGQELWDVLLKTPLIIRAPGAAPARLAVARSQLDLAPTIIELMGLPRQEPHQGQSLLPELFGAAAQERPVQLFELCEDVENPGLRAMIAGDEKLVVPSRAGAERLFNLKADSSEAQDLAESQPARLRAMAVRFEGEWGRVSSVEPYGGMKLSSGRLAQGPERPPRSP